MMVDIEDIGMPFTRSGIKTEDGVKKEEPLLYRGAVKSEDGSVEVERIVRLTEVNTFFNIDAQEVNLAEDLALKILKATIDKSSQRSQYKCLPFPPKGHDH